MSSDAEKLKKRHERRLADSGGLAFPQAAAPRPSSPASSYPPAPPAAMEGPSVAPESPREPRGVVNPPPSPLETPVQAVVGPLRPPMASPQGSNRLKPVSSGLNSLRGTGPMGRVSLSCERAVYEIVQRRASQDRIPLTEAWRMVLSSPLPTGWWNKVFTSTQVTPERYFTKRRKEGGGRYQTTVIAPASLLEALNAERDALDREHSPFGPNALSSVLEAHALVWALVEDGQDPMAL